MKAKSSHLIRRTAISAAIAFAIATNAYGQSFSGLYSQPLIGSISAAPNILLTMQRDARLFVEAYDDASDINGDGVIDTKYNPALYLYDPATGAYTTTLLDYFGYFDSYKCYEYKTYSYGSGGSAGTVDAFVPIGDTDSGAKTCTGYTKNGLKGPWSGDFLNYLTTTRIDAMRKVLYGGKRYLDLPYVNGKKTSHTVLERANIPQDIHAFGKEYNSMAADGYKISDYTPLSEPAAGKRHLFANVTLGKTSDAKPPIVRILTDRTERAWDWIASEYPNVAGTNLNGTAVSPTDLNVRVVVCDTTSGDDQTPSQGPDANGYCKTYGDNSTKPTGILHEFGEQNSVYFGLLTGSAIKNFSGGILRKAISSFTDEVNPTTGEFLSDYKNDSSITKPVKGIVFTLDRLQVQPFTGPGWGAFSGSSGESSSAGVVGNPVAEMMYEGLRYLAGQSTPTSAYINGITVSNGLTNESPKLPAIVSSWTNPYTAGSANLCAKPTQMVISDVNPTFDSDQLPGSSWASGASFTGSFSTLNVSTLADNIWTSEGLGTKNVIIGEKYGNTSNVGMPTVKSSVSGFSQIRGLVPEDPLWQGSYFAGAVAKFGKENDLKALGNPAFASSTITSRTINTSAVALSSALPRIAIPVSIGGLTTLVTVVPYGQTYNGGEWKFAEFSKLFVDNIKNVPGATTDSSVNGGYPYLKMQVTFSDSSLYRDKGHDNDMDARATYEVYWDNAASKIVVNVCADPFPDGQTSGSLTSSTQTVRCNRDGNDGLGYSATGVAGMHLGYSISGVTLPSGEETTRMVVRNNAYNTGTTGMSHPLDLPSARISGSFVDNYFNSGNSTTTGLTTYAVAGDGKSLRLNNSISYTVGNSSAAGVFIEHDPLWYAAKYGGYNDDNTNKQLDGSEWVGDDGVTPTSYYKVSNPALLREQISKAITPTLVSGSSFAATASNSTDLKTLTGIYQGKYIAKYWSGRLTAYSIDTSSGTIDTTTPLWEAASVIPAAASRNIYTYRRETGSPTGISFLWNVLNNNEKTQLSNNTNFLSYLRGDRANEGTGATNYRVRDSATVLGDIINSPPIFSGNEDLGYSALVGTEGTSYTTFLSSIKASRTKAVYVGANDGMLHAFRASDGVELFAYIPRASLYGDNASKLNSLTSKTYAHKYYVDGPMVVGDFYDSVLSTPAWRSVLVGTMGAGGRSIFALDVTNPSSFSASSVLWEFSHPELGYGRNPPIIARLNDGNWYAIVGNGFESNTCSSSVSPRYKATSSTSPTPACSTILATATRNAKLFIIKLHPDLSNGWTYGSDYHILHATDTQIATTPPSVTTGTYANGTDNGLAGPATKDRISSGVSYVYAGDLQGNIWKFNLSSNDPTQWGVAYDLFQATDSNGTSQPITSTLAVGSKPNSTDACVSAGTGRFAYEGDLVYKGVQSAYGIQDSGSAVSTRSNSLQQYSVVSKSTETIGGKTWNLKYVSDDTFDTSKQGWFIDLIEPPGTTPREIGERIIQSPIQTTLRSGELMASFVTSIPTGDACDATGVSYALDFNACTGEGLSTPTFDLDGNLIFNNVDKGTPPSGGRLGGVQVGGSSGGSGSSAMCFESASGGLKGCSFDLGVLSCTDGRIETIKKPPTSTSCGVKRTSWRQLR